MDSDMVLEVPDTPDRVIFARSATAESLLHSCRLEDKPSSSNQYLEPANRARTRPLKTAGLHNLDSNEAMLMDTDFLFKQAKLAQLISDSPESKTSNLCSSSPKHQGSVMNNGGTSTEMIGLCQESSFKHPHPARCRGRRLKLDKHLNRQNEKCPSSECCELLGVRSSIPTTDIVKARSNAGQSSKRFDGYWNMGGEKNKVYAKGASSNKEKVSVQEVNSGSSREKLPLESFQIDVQSIEQQGKPVSNGCTDPFHVANNSMSIEGEDGKNPYKLGNSTDQRACSSLGTRDQDKELWKESQSTTRQVSHRRPELGARPRNGHRRLVRNGCISPCNVAKNKKDLEFKGTQEESSTFGKVIDLSSPLPMQTKGSSSASSAADKGKGKALINESSQNQCNESNPLCRRPFLIPRKEITISNMEHDICVIGVDEEGTGVTNFVRTKGCNDLNLEVTQHSGKRKVSSTHPNIGECSISNIDIPVARNGWAPGKPLNSRSTRSRRSSRDEIMASIVEIDDSCNNNQEESHELSDESIARAIQLESDEVLARQLQEQFYLESPTVASTEFDSTMTWPSFQEADDHVSIRRRNQSRLIEDAAPILLVSPRFRPSSTRATTRVRMANRFGHMRSSSSRSSSSLEERLNFLEALEAAFEDNNGQVPNQILQSYQDFSVDDYEMLLSLDEDNHRHVGATESQINNLPQSIIQSQNAGSEEACAVCLETPSLGDTIKHLPCFHKFHKECIDTWLRRKRMCPICKCGIT